ncbi:MAG: hypothetical protein GY679_01205 [Mycoplasma sp.]|nr:hypothetical protein [Mycoplasma sp.]
MKKTARIISIVKLERDEYECRREWPKHSLCQAFPGFKGRNIAGGKEESSAFFEVFIKDFGQIHQKGLTIQEAEEKAFKEFQDRLNNK